MDLDFWTFYFFDFLSQKSAANGLYSYSQSTWLPKIVHKPPLGSCLPL